MVDDTQTIDELVRKIQIIALFVAMGDGHVSAEDLEYLDEEAPGYIRYCLEGRAAFEALLEGKVEEEISSLLPEIITHSLSAGSLFGKGPAWAKEALDARRASGDIAKYETNYASALEDPWDQMVAHYFALKLLTFSGLPDQGEVKAYLLMIAGWANGGAPIRN